MRTRNTLVYLLIALFFVSGATSLVYETVWARQLHLVFGTSQLAICTLLAAFMTGLALGGFAGARWAARVRRPLVVYAILEAVIGLYAILFPALLKVAAPIYLLIHHVADPGPLAFGVIQFVLLGLLLLPPTVCMGATLPLLARFISSRQETGRQIARLYGANTLGAVAGTALAGFVLLPTLGLAVTTWSAATANWVLAALALGVARWMHVDPLPTATHAQTSTRLPRGILAIALIGGAAALLYELSWFRLMVLLLGGSAYSFSIMLLSFLLGLGLGGWMIGRIADRVAERRGVAGLLILVAWLEAGIAVLALIGLFAYEQMPFAFLWMYDLVEAVPSMLWPGKLLLAMMIMVPPAFLMGAVFPVLVRAAAGDNPAVSRPVGAVYGVNTIGAVIGAFLGGFVILPALHVVGSVTLAAAANLVAAIVAVGLATHLTTRSLPIARLTRWSIASVLIMTFVHVVKPRWNPLLMTSGVYKYVSMLDHDSRHKWLEQTVHSFELKYYNEGLSSVVAVVHDPEFDNTWLSNNGKVDASSRGDLDTQILLAHLPFAFRPKAENILVIGLASGVSAGSVTLHDSPTNIDIVELEPAVVEASHFFDDINHRPLEDPRVNLIENDARNHLLLTRGDTYDLISSEPSNPWLSGVSNLFTREFFRLGKRRLTDDGIWCQWIQLYAMNGDDLRSLLATFAECYTYVRLFRVDASDLIVLGSDEPLPLSASQIGNVFGGSTELSKDITRAGVRNPADILARYVTDRRGILDIAGDVERNTDDNMRIEYSAPLNLHADTLTDNSRLLLIDADTPIAAFRTADGLAELAKAFTQREDYRRAMIAAHAAESRDASLQGLKQSVQAAASSGHMP